MTECDHWMDTILDTKNRGDNGTGPWRLSTGQALRKLPPLVAFRKKIYQSIEELQQDLDAYIERYNTRRENQGKRCQGLTPMQTFLDNLPVAMEKNINNEELPLTA